MRFLDNMIWFIFGGLIMGLSWPRIGLLWCITLIGIPVGIQYFKLAGLAFSAFDASIH